jgi:hypothetical protein
MYTHTHVVEVTISSICVCCLSLYIYLYLRPAAVSFLFCSLVPLIGGLAPVINANEPPATISLARRRLQRLQYKRTSRSQPGEIDNFLLEKRFHFKDGQKPMLKYIKPPTLFFWVYSAASVCVCVCLNNV